MFYINIESLQGSRYLDSVNVWSTRFKSKGLLSEKFKGRFSLFSAIQVNERLFPSQHLGCQLGYIISASQYFVIVQLLVSHMVAACCVINVFSLGP